jgi:hypothetical protein
MGMAVAAQARHAATSIRPRAIVCCSDGVG